MYVLNIYGLIGLGYQLLIYTGLGYQYVLPSFPANNIICYTRFTNTFIKKIVKIKSLFLLDSAQHDLFCFVLF